MSIEYVCKEGQKPCEKEPLKVRLDGKIVGEIRKVNFGFKYYPNCRGDGGELFPSLHDCKKSLEGEE